jgi:hypothetical protein
MLYLTYDNEVMTDGAGAQFQRIISIYLTAKFFNLGYIHQGLSSMEYQGAKCLENNTSDPQQIDDYNKLINFPSTHNLTQFAEIYKVFDISEEIIDQFKNKSEDILLLIRFAATMLDTKPEIMLQPIPLAWTIRPTLFARPVHVAIHIRRGELFVIYSDRMLPNSYYVKCMRALHTLFTQAGIPYEFHLHTEVITKPTLITPDSHGILNRITDPVLLTPEDSHMEDFNEFVNCKFHINEYPVDTLKALVLSDVLLASRSSFSYVAAILKKKGVVLFHPFWHGLSPDWIPCSDATDIFNAKDKILNKLV